MPYPNKRRGCTPEELDEGKLQVLFCEGAHSNLGANTPVGGGMYEPYSTERIEISFPYNPVHIVKIKAIEGCHIYFEHCNQCTKVLLRRGFKKPKQLYDQKFNL
jgi:hypothetical protein